ncbi:MAG: hypothetical protein COW30_00940 [Rhodospirillales bacterium CG15_BIG_FIL_POST_REV_8_21_14_020_66_15]|nr:MAG: hypothetical protein COW30_00940 [Rhodospirillales bacterium CG15_BIG_FIL_POST_REV_8_21_14_020_66_15]
MQTTATWVALGALAALKAGFLIALGPVYLPDSDDYVLFADAILAGDRWARSLDLSGELYPLTAFRGIGYPALIALFKVLFGGAWDWALVSLQMLLSLGATAMVWRLARRLTGRTWAAALAAAGQALGLAFVLDQCVLTDSLHASLLVILAAHAGAALIDGRPPGLREALGLGAVLLLTFLLREAGAVMHLALWPLIVAWGFGTAAGLRRGALVLVVFVLPLFLGVQGYKAWNQLRTGERFVTTVAQTAMYHPVVDLARRGLPVFAEDPLLADARDLLPLDPIPGVSFTRINRHLRQAHGMTALDAARHAETLFYDHWRRYPLDRAEIYLRRLLRPEYARLAFMPLSGPERLSLWAGGGTPFPGPGEIRRNLFEDGRIDQALLLAARTVARLISAALTAAFLIGVPVVVVRALAGAGWKPAGVRPRTLAMAGLWTFVMAYPAVYALVYLEDRYLAAVAPLVAVVGLALLAPWAERTAAGIRARIAGRAT